MPDNQAQRVYTPVRPTDYVGRFAPSPSGPLHFGSLVAAVASYMQAVDQEGRWYVRIDDIDPPRIKQDAISEILSLLDQCGFFRRDNGGAHFNNRHASLSTPSTAVTLQSESDDRYQQTLDNLTSRNNVYACECSRRQLGKQIVYPGTCRERQLAIADSSTGLINSSANCDANHPPANHAIRFRVPDKNILFNDRVFGAVKQNVAQEVGDFVIKRRDGLWSYQLATVVDDWHDRVTEVVRGADLLDNTPRQITLAQQSGFKQPDFLHVPVALDSNGKKLSKQTQAEAVDEKNPLPALRTVWRFLRQPEPLNCETIAQFWQHAELSWDNSRIPATQAMELPKS